MSSSQITPPPLDDAEDAPALPVEAIGRRGRRRAEAAETAELAEAWHRQLRTPLRSSAGFAQPSARPSTFGELLSHPSPTPDDLRHTAAVALSLRGESISESGTPAEVAAALFFAACVASHVRCGCPVTRDWDAASLRRAADWVISLSWLDEPTRQLFLQAAHVLPEDVSSADAAAQHALPPVLDFLHCPITPTDIAPDEDPPILETHRGTEPAKSDQDQYPDIDGYHVLFAEDADSNDSIYDQFRAVQLGSRRQVTIRLSKSNVGGDRARLRIERDVDLAARLDHPAIARMFTGGLYRGAYYYVTQPVSGTSIERWVREKRLNTRQIVEMMAEVCRAVASAHMRGVIHGSLTSANIRVNDEGRPCVQGFGLPPLRGDPDYTPPDACLTAERTETREARPDTRVDVYGLGMILFHLLTGTPDRNMVSVDRSLNAELDIEITSILLKATDVPAEMRYPWAGDLANELTRYLAGEPVVVLSHRTLYIMRKRLKKSALAMALIASAAILLIAASGFAIATAIAH